MLSNPAYENCVVDEIMQNDMVQPDGTQMTIYYIACA
jgi:hypothetical protein